MTIDREMQELRAAAEDIYKAPHLTITDVTIRGEVHLRALCGKCGNVSHLTEVVDPVEGPAVIIPKYVANRAQLLEDGTCSECLKPRSVEQRDDIGRVVGPAPVTKKKRRTGTGPASAETMTERG